jgi:hypothetical protein
MDCAEFMASLAECARTTETYVGEVNKTSFMLGKCGPQPLTFEMRFALLAQEILERNAFLAYMEAKRILHRVALLGYEGLGYDGLATDCSQSQPITKPSSQKRGRCRATKPR